jgi:hypothetical protein
MKIQTNLVTTCIFAITSNTVFGQEESTYIGDPECIIKDEAACTKAAEFHALTYVPGGEKGGHAWGCFVNEDNEVIFDDKKSKGKKCDGKKKCKEKFDVIPDDGEHQRMFCGGTSLAEAENAAEEDLVVALEPTCFDYTSALDLGPTECTQHSLFVKIRDVYDLQRQVEGAEQCPGGVHKEVMTLTGTTDWSSSVSALQALCDKAHKAATEEIPDNSWGFLENEPHAINVDEFMQGEGFLNKESGNFWQKNRKLYKARWLRSVCVHRRGSTQK